MYVAVPFSGWGVLSEDWCISALRKRNSSSLRFQRLVCYVLNIHFREFNSHWGKMRILGWALLRCCLFIQMQVTSPPLIDEMRCAVNFRRREGKAWCYWQYRHAFIKHFAAKRKFLLSHFHLLPCLCYDLHLKKSSSIKWFHDLMLLVLFLKGDAIFASQQIILNVSLDIYSWCICITTQGSFPCLQSFVVSVCELITSAFV